MYLKSVAFTCKISLFITMRRVLSIIRIWSANTQIKEGEISRNCE